MSRWHWAEKVLLVDYDGVLVNFTQAFDLYMFDKGHYISDLSSYDVAGRYDSPEDIIYEEMHNFVHSDDFRHMPAMPHARKYIKKLRDEGWVFHCITAAPAERLQDRIKNAEELFGVGIFQRIHCIGLNKCKKNYLQKYEGSRCFWVEDKPSNAMDALEFGLRPILIHHTYNAHFQNDQVYNAKDWIDIYNKVTTGDNNEF